MPLCFHPWNFISGNKRGWLASSVGVQDAGIRLGGGGPVLLVFHTGSSWVPGLAFFLVPSRSEGPGLADGCLARQLALPLGTPPIPMG